MAVQIQFRRDTAANFLLAEGAPWNKIYAAGEMCVETDTLRYKLGDGVTGWSGLAYGVFDGFTSGRRYAFDDATADSDPGAGKLRFNHATFASITQLFIDNADAPGGDATAWLDGLDDSSDPSNKGTLFIQKLEDAGVYREFIVGGAVTDGTGYRKVPVTPLSSNGALADDDQLVVAFYRTGAAGSVASTGSKADLVAADAIIIKDSEDSDAVKEIAWDDFQSETFDALSVDEDDMASNSATKLPTQQSAKAYVDGKVAPLGFALQGHLHGLTLSNNASDATNDIDITIGTCASYDTAPVLMRFASAMTKRLDADWQAGTGNGMRYSGAAIANTTYHIFAVAKADGSDADFYAYPASEAVATVLSALQAETGGSLYTKARRIGSIIRASGAILGFVQDGDEFLLKSPVLDVNLSSTLGTTASLLSLTVPAGIKVRAILEGHIFHSGGSSVLITSPDQTDTAPSGTGIATSANQANQYGEFQKIVRTNTSGQVRARSNVTVDFFRLTTHGWHDHRRRLS